MSDPALEARDIGFDYPGGIAALTALNLTIARGQRLAILGPNGASKITLLLHLNGTLRPKTGGIFLNGAPGGNSRGGLRAWRGTVGLVLQKPDDQLFSASVRQDISFGPLNLSLPDDAVRARVVDHPTHMLSFGQKKRVAIAGIMAMRPAVLVLDEPIARLDPSGERHLLKALDGLHQAGTTLVFSTHDIDFAWAWAWAWADDVALFKDGQVLRQGTAEEILLDAPLLAEVGLAPPLIAEVARRLPGHDPALPPPRTRQDLLDLLSGA